MADDLMIEVTGSAKNAESALDRVIAKLESLRNTFDKLAPSLTKFTEKMNSIASSSKAMAGLKSITDATSKNAMSAKDAESKMAMYQARLDRATVSMNKSAVASAKLAEAQRKLKEATTQDAETNAFLSKYRDKGFTNEPSAVNRFSEPTATDVFTSTPPRGSSAMASDFVGKANKTIPINFNTSPAQSAIDRVRVFIDSLTPSISKMSAEAQAKFETLSAELTRVSAQIDNQRALYSQLGAATKNVDEGSSKFLSLEKRMLSADGAIDRLVAKSDKLKAQMLGISDSASKASFGFLNFGNRAEKATKKSTSGVQKTLQMMEKMFIRIIAFRIFSMVTQGITTGINNMVQANKQANATMSALATSSLYLKNSIAAALMPTIQALTPFIVNLIDHLADLFNMIGMLTARIFNHASTVSIAKKSAVDYAASIAKVGQAAKEAQKSILGFDEINALSKPTSSSNNGMPDVSTMFETVKIPQWVNNIGAVTDQVGKVISDWWNGLTNEQKWGAGIGGTAGFIIGGIIGGLIGGPIGRVVGAALGAAAGVAIGTWWAGLTTKEKWASGIGGGAGAVIGGIIGGILTGGNPIGIAVGAALGGTAGLIAGKWWADLTTPEKWSAGVGAGAGAVIGGIMGGILTAGNPIGIAVGAVLGVTAGGIIGKWWSDLTTPQKWSAGIGAGAGAVIGGIIGGLIAGPIGAAVGALLGGTAGTIIANWWSTLKTQEKWEVGTTAIGAVLGGIIGGIFLGPLGIVLGAGIGGLAADLIKRFWDYLKDPNNWKVAAGTGIGAVIGAIIGTVIGGPIGMAIGAALGGAAGGAIGKLIQGHANGTAYHTGGPAFINDQSGSIYRELVQLPNGMSFIPQGRNILFPDLPIGTKVLPAAQTKQLFPNYSDGIGELGTADLFQNPDAISFNGSAFSGSSKGSRGVGGLFSEDVLYRAFSRALEDMPVPEVNVKTNLDSRPIATRVETEIKKKSARYSPVKQY